MLGEVYEEGRRVWEGGMRVSAEHVEGRHGGTPLVLYDANKRGPEEGFTDRSAW